MAITKGRTSTAHETKTLKVGDAAPAVTLTSHLGETWNLADFKGKKHVVIAFYPFAFTAV